MKNKEIQRPRNMSQLDYLWTTYGSYKVSNEVDTENDSSLTCKSLYPTWKSCIGSSLKAGDKVTHKGLLYKVKQTVNPVLENQAPGKETASLYEEINEAHEGTKEDPIPYNGNMQLILGKYYSQDEVTYLCSRDSGQAVYNPLKDLVGIYVIVAE